MRCVPEYAEWSADCPENLRIRPDPPDPNPEIWIPRPGPAWGTISARSGGIRATTDPWRRTDGGMRGRVPDRAGWRRCRGAGWRPDAGPGGQSRTRGGQSERAAHDRGSDTVLRDSRPVVQGRRARAGAQAR